MSSVTLKLKSPIEFGKTTLEELVVVPTPRAYKGFSLSMTPEGKIDYQPYELATIGMRMAGQSSGAVDKMSIADMNALAQLVLSFFGESPTAGSEP